ncbi:MAG: sugar ABC transporter permease [Treponema sp.]|nr:sugar ABC transporter permease [Treponema sp.]
MRKPKFPHNSIEEVGEFRRPTKKGTGLKDKSSSFGILMTSPTIAILAGFTIFPLFFTLFYSFTDYYFLARKPAAGVGLNNYIELLKNGYFLQAIRNTVKFVILAVVIETGAGLFTAVFINSFTKNTKLLRTLILLPTLMPPVTVALMWQTMLSNNYGIINRLLGVLRLGPVNWLMDIKTAFYAILVIDVWQYTPMAFLLIYASMQTIPQVQYEAARMDGAGPWAQFRYITVPNISSGILMVVLMRTIDTFRLFDKVNILTKGGPANSTATMTQFIYQQGVRGLKVGYGSAASVIMTVMVLLFSIAYVRKMIRRS